ncbi:MAG: calcium/sodium antiporter [Prolixibacteraceae bacterium]|jgi:cation:H+ antiporter|nr:calcium/sodium antiporter [Prolixibacteraceae bacterium]
MDSSLLINLSLLIFGILVLVFSGDLLVKGSVALANHFKISSLVIGLTVVAFGTSAPELVVSLGAALSGSPDIAVSNVIGSNIANIALVLALTVVILPMPVAAQSIKRSWPIMFISGIALYITMYSGVITHIEGIALFLLLIAFIISSLKSSKKFPQTNSIPKPSNKHKIWVYVGFVLVASVGLAFGSKLLVNNAKIIALSMGVSERIIGLTAVAFGTSVPELTASIVAAFKKETDISVGNIVGSNIFNVFAVIGITSGIHSIPLNFAEFQLDLYVMMGVYLLLFIFILPLGYLLKKNENTISVRYKQLSGGRISRVEGTILFLLYVGYLILIFNT